MPTAGTTTVRLPTDLVVAIRNLADYHERSLGGELRWALKQYRMDSLLEEGILREEREMAFARRQRQVAQARAQREREEDERATGD